MQKNLLNINAKRNFNPLKSRPLIYLFCGVMLTGYILDLVFVDFPIPVYCLNLANIIMGMVVLILFYLNKIEIGNVIQINILGLLANLLLSFIFNSPNDANYVSMFMRNAFIMFLFIPVYGLYCGKNNIFHIGIAFLILFVSVSVRANNAFLINNAPILIFGIIMYHLTFYYMIDALEKMQQNQIELNENLASQKDQLILQNHDLAQKNQHIIDQAKELSETIATKDKLFSIIAHDLRSPFNSIIGFSDLLIHNIEEYDKDKILKYAEQINISAKPTLAILDNLLNWAKSQTGQLNFEPESIQLASLFGEIDDIIHPSATLKNIAIITDFQPKNMAIFADKHMFKSVLFNLLSNAIKFTNAHGEVVVKAHQKNGHIEISVTDNGVGMTDEQRQKLFNGEIPETTRGTAKEPGSGLGLVLCKEFVEKHGGKIWVESRLGKGSTFKFTLLNAQSKLVT